MKQGLAERGAKPAAAASSAGCGCEGSDRARHTVYPPVGGGPFLHMPPGQRITDVSMQHCYNYFFFQNQSNSRITGSLLLGNRNFPFAVQPSSHNRKFY